MAALFQLEKAKLFLDEERRCEDRSFELAKILEERQAAAKAARLREGREAAASSAKEQTDLARIREERDAVLARMREEREAEVARMRLQNAAAEAAAEAAARAAADAAVSRAAEIANELALRELEVANPHIGQRPPASAFRLDTAIKCIPKFDEKNVEEYLIAFEKSCEVNDCPRDKYASILQPSLIGNGIKVFFSELPGDSCNDYPRLKAALLTAYSVVSEVHRKKFCNLSKRNEETFSDFGFLLSNHCKRWTREKTLMLMSNVYELHQVARNNN